MTGWTLEYIRALDFYDRRAILEIVPGLNAARAQETLRQQQRLAAQNAPKRRRR